MKPSLREVLANSHIAAVAIAILLIWSLGSGVRALERPLLSVIDFLVTMVAIRDIPYFHFGFSLGYGVAQIPTLTHLFNAVTSLSAAWVLSRWVYKVGPCRGLIECRIRLARRNHV